MKKPNFFIVGAPKCGTTALAYWLRAHPRIFISARKEPHYFNTDGWMATRTLSEYEDLFSTASEEHHGVGEASTRYLFSEDAARNIVSYNSDAKFIVCLRNPLEMAISLHSERLTTGQENIRSFEGAWASQATRAMGKRIPGTVKDHPEQLQYGKYCLLGEQLARLYRYVESESVETVLLEDMRAQPDEEYRRILSFLAVEDCGRESFEAINSSKHTRSTNVAILIQYLSNIKSRMGLDIPTGFGRMVTSINIKHQARPPVHTDVIEEMKEYFREDVQLLSRLLDRDLTHWTG